MKALTKQQLHFLTTSVADTAEHELDCSECARFAAQYAEQQSAGVPPDALMVSVEQHLQVCPECREEMVALRQILEAGQ